MQGVPGVYLWVHPTACSWYPPLDTHVTSVTHCDSWETLQLVGWCSHCPGLCSPLEAMWHPHLTP